MAHADLHFPLVAMTPADDGGWNVSGVASDEGSDLENEQVEAIGGALNYLKAHGGINYDHGGTRIGEITDVGLTTGGRVKEMFPDYPWEPDDVQGNAIVWHGRIFPLRGANDPEDLRTVHYLAQNGADIGGSLEGNRVMHKVESDGVLKSSAVFSDIALTDKPIHQRSYSTFSKGFGEFIKSLTGNGDEEKPPRELEYVYVAKAISAGAGVDAGSFAGGRAMQPEALDGVVPTTALAAAHRRRDAFRVLKALIGQDVMTPTGLDAFLDAEEGRRDLYEAMPAKTRSLLEGLLEKTEERLFEKGRRKAHARRTKSGKVAQVKEAQIKDRALPLAGGTRPKRKKPKPRKPSKRMQYRADFNDLWGTAFVRAGSPTIGSVDDAVRLVDNEARQLIDALEEPDDPRLLELKPKARPLVRAAKAWWRLRHDAKVPTALDEFAALGGDWQQDPEEKRFIQANEEALRRERAIRKERLFEKGRRKPHARRTKSGKVTQVKEARIKDPKLAKSQTRGRVNVFTKLPAPLPLKPGSGRKPKRGRRSKAGADGVAPRAIAIHIEQTGVLVGIPAERGTPDYEAIVTGQAERTGLRRGRWVQIQWAAGKRGGWVDKEIAAAWVPRKAKKS